MSAADEREEEQVVIRRYRPEDAARVKAITAEAFEPVSIDAAVDRRWPGLAPVPWAERKWLSMQPQLADHPEHCWVAVGEGEDVIGYVTCEVLAERGVGRIPDLAVDARWRGKGLGRRLVLHALAYFRELGLPLAKIETLAHNQVGQRLYPSLGFQLVATQYHYVMPLVAPSTPETGSAPAGIREHTAEPRSGASAPSAGERAGHHGPRAGGTTESGYLAHDVQPSSSLTQ